MTPLVVPANEPSALERGADVGQAGMAGVRGQNGIRESYGDPEIS